MAKKNFYESKFIEVFDSLKFTWKLINNITSIKNKNDVEIKSIIVNNEIITTSEDSVRVSNIFNKFFTSISSHLKIKIKQPSTHFVEPYTSESFDMVFNETISTHEVLNIINKLKDKTAAGPDGLSVKTIKYIAECILIPLSTNVYL